MRKYLILAGLSLISVNAYAQLPDGFTKGPVFNDFGPVIEVALSTPLPENLTIKHSFDAVKAAEDGKANRSLESAARFINMHARAGVDPKDMQVAVVVHGGATGDVMKSEDGKETATAKLVAALIAKGQRVIVCGQSAAANGFDADDMQPGVEMALSAMTAHVLLQQEGYTTNPF